MTTTTTVSPAADTARPPTRRVTDAATRAMHWLMALSFAGAYLTADGERWRYLHVTLGYTLAGVFVARILWGLFGPRQVRLALLARKLSGLPQWLARLRSAPMATSWQQGQNLLMALAVALMLACVLPLTASGFITYQDWGGDWLEEVHEFFGNTMLAVVLAHIGLIALLSALRRKNQALPMLTGRVAGKGPDLAQSNHGILATLLLAAVLAFWAWQWQTAPSAPADGGAYSQHHNGDDD